jgi:hypothetical protein
VLARAIKASTSSLRCGELGAWHSVKARISGLQSTSNALGVEDVMASKRRRVSASNIACPTARAARELRRVEGLDEIGRRRAHVGAGVFNRSSLRWLGIST